MIAAHPDDETIGAGALLSRNKGVQIVYVTDGAPPGILDALAAGLSSREAYASARIAEARSALALAGVESRAICRLQFTDQEVSFQLGELTIKILQALDGHPPDFLLTHAYEGGHPDHDSAALACHMAHRMYCANHNGAGPLLMEFAGYHGEHGRIRTNQFLPQSGPAENRRQLTADEANLKTQMLREFKTQSRTLQAFLPPRFEAYRQAPKYDFGRAPHAGKLFYENFNWGMDGGTWRGLAQKLVRELSLPG